MNIFLILPILFFFSCTSTRKQPQFIPAQYKKAFQVAMNDLESGRYNEAIEGFENITQQQQEGFIYYSALFNIGSAYQKLKQCEKSKEIFSLIAEKIDDYSIFKAQSLLQLHYAYECLGETERALSALKSADKRKDKLNETSQLVEIPSRFSILYAQLENNNQSLFFRDKAFDGIKKIKFPIKDKAILDQVVAKLFYIMGHSLVRASSIKMKQYLLAFSHHQIYLIQSYLLNDLFWSPKAEQELSQLYEKLWLAYKKLSNKDQVKHKNQIIKILSDFQKIAQESHSPKLNKLLSSITDKAVDRFKL